MSDNAAVDALIQDGYAAQDAVADARTRFREVQSTLRGLLATERLGVLTLTAEQREAIAALAPERKPRESKKADK